MVSSIEYFNYNLCRWCISFLYCICCSGSSGRRNIWKRRIYFQCFHFMLYFLFYLKHIFVWSRQFYNIYWLIADFSKRFFFYNLLIGFLQLVHKNCNNDIDKDKLRNENEYNEVDDRCDIRNATIPNTINRCIAFRAQNIFHDAAPVVTSCYTKQRKKSHTKVDKISMVIHGTTGVIIVTFC